MTPPSKAAAGFWTAAAPVKVATLGAGVIAMVGTGASVVVGGGAGASVVTGAAVVTGAGGGGGVVRTGAGGATELVVQISQVVAGDGATDDGTQVYTGEEVVATVDQT